MKHLKICIVAGLVMGLLLTYVSCSKELPRFGISSGAIKTKSTGNGELFYSDYPYAFVSKATNKPVLINGVNIIRAPHRNASGVWQTPYINEEITALGQQDAPDFNAIRIAMQWPIFEPAPDTMNSEAFNQLDILIDNAISQGLYVILDVMHLYPSQTCDDDPAMKGAQWGIPKWAWEAVGATGISDNNCASGNDTRNLMADVLGLQSTADYIKYILNRYNASTTRGRQVIAIDLVNEPAAAAVTTAQGEFSEILPVYSDWLSASGSKSLRTANADKILIVEPPHGNISLAGMNLSALQHPNVVFSFHDYFGMSTYTSPVYGMGYSDQGWANKSERTDVGNPIPYNPTVLSYADRLSEHKAYVQQWLDWLGVYHLPLYIGEYGIRNPCGGGDLAYSAQYARDVFQVYQNMFVVINGTAVHIPLPRTWWSHGYWNSMALWNRGSACHGTGNKEYFPYAYELTGELNKVSNAGFEEGLSDWTTTGPVSLAVITGPHPEDIRSGINAAAVWSSGAYTATLQNGSAASLATGTYTADVWSRTGGTFNQKIFRIYVNGTLAGTSAIPVSSSWTATSVNNINVPAGATVKVEIALDAGAGAWAQFDDFELRKN